MNNVGITEGFLSKPPTVERNWARANDNIWGAPHFWSTIFRHPCLGRAVVTDSYCDTSGGVRVMMDLKLAAAFHKGESPFYYFIRLQCGTKREREWQKKGGDPLVSLSLWLQLWHEPVTFQLTFKYYQEMICSLIWQYDTISIPCYKKRGWARVKAYWLRRVPGTDV